MVVTSRNLSSFLGNERYSIDPANAEDAVGIPESHDLLPDDIYNDAIALFDKIKSAEIVVPDSEEGLKSFKAGL